MRYGFGRTLALATGALTLIAWSVASDPVTLRPESRLWVDGGSTVRDWSCKAPTLEAVIAASSADAVAAVLAGTNAVTTVKLTVPIERMDCGNGQMNEHMRKALKAKDYPTITFSLDTYTLTKADTLTAGVLNGTLTIGGVTKPIVLPVGFRLAPDGGLRATGTYEVNMRDYKLEPPSLMFGTIKVRERVKVSFDLLLKA